MRRYRSSHVIYSFRKNVAQALKDKRATAVFCNGLRSLGLLSASLIALLLSG
jgi:hypothetical protein